MTITDREQINYKTSKEKEESEKQDRQVINWKSKLRSDALVAYSPQNTLLPLQKNVWSV